MQYGTINKVLNKRERRVRDRYVEDSTQVSQDSILAAETALNDSLSQVVVPPNPDDEIWGPIKRETGQTPELVEDPKLGEEAKKAPAVDDKAAKEEKEAKAKKEKDPDKAEKEKAKEKDSDKEKPEKEKDSKEKEGKAPKEKKEKAPKEKKEKAPKEKKEKAPKEKKEKAPKEKKEKAPKEKKEKAGDEEG
jgi:hypothetical protein